MLGLRGAYLLTNILSSPYCTFFILPGGWELEANLKLRLVKHAHLCLEGVQQRRGGRGGRPHQTE